MEINEYYTPVLSIIIPTRNRFQYVTHAIKSLLNIKSVEFELVIHDSSDTKKLEAYIADNICDTRLRYFYSDPPLTFSETFNKSVLLSSGEYVCIIGDDDGVNPEIVEAAKWAKEQNIDAITPLINISYFWPDFRFKYYKNANAGYLKIGNFTGKVFFPDVEKEMLKCAQGAFQDFSLLPKIYNGIVRRISLEKVYQKTGSYFFGASPDISGSLAVASFINRLCIIDYPLVIAGNSALSGSGRSAMKQHVGRLDEEPQTKPFYKKWPENVPAFYSVQTVWAQAAIEGLRATGRVDLLQHYNSTLLQALCLVYNPNYINIILKNFINVILTKRTNVILEASALIKYIITNYYKRAKSHFCRLTRKSCFEFDYESTNLISIEDAAYELTAYLSNNSINFTSVTAKYTVEAANR